MKDKIAEKILKMEKDKLMSEPESDRDWELITALDIAINALDEKPKGEWIEMSDNYGYSSYFCSHCGTQEGKAKNVCPNCGLKMKGIKKETENG